MDVVLLGLKTPTRNERFCLLHSWRISESSFLPNPFPLYPSRISMPLEFNIPPTKLTPIIFEFSRSILKI